MKAFKKISTAVAAVCALGLLGPVIALAASPAAVNLGSAGSFALLSKTGISTTGSTAVVGDIGISPAAASYITGFGLILPAANPFSTSALVTGKVYASDYANPTPANLTTAVLDMQTAYSDAAGRASTVTELGAGNIGGLTLSPGVYKWGTGLVIPTDVTLSGGANDVWIFQVAQTLTVSSGAKINLSGGAQAGNIFWVVAGQTTIGTTAVFNGNILDQTAIVLNTGARLNGRALAQTAITLDSNPIMISTSVVAASTPTPPVLTPIPVFTPAPNQTPTPVVVNPPSNANAGYNPPVSSVQITYQGGQPMPAYGTPGYGVASANAYISPTLPAVPAFGQQVRTISTSLWQGDRGNDVTILQQFLISQNKGSAAQALANVGASSYFGVLTRAALAEFQANVGISPPLGNFGPITRAYLSANYQ
jgi:hypothetical protein